MNPSPLLRRFSVSLAVATAVLLISISRGTAAEVQATLDRESVVAGHGALMNLTITGSGNVNPQLPEVKDMIIQARGQSRQLLMSNGTIISALTYSYVVGSNVAGDYEIPAFNVTVDGKEYTTQPLKLKVLATNAAQPPAGMAPNPAPGNPEPEPEDDARKFGFLTVELVASSRDYVYVGEIAPVRIQAWLPANSRAQRRSGVQPEGLGFTLHNVSDQPQQTQAMKDGRRYTVVTWYGGISATRAGKLPASLSLDATVAVRDTSAPIPRRHRTGPFADPFFDDAFDNAPMIQKDVTLKSEDQEIDVRALPAEGRPEGFHGAVGKFKFEDFTLPTEWVTGEPQQIRATLSGSGNFALADAPELTPPGTWKSYPFKSDFTPGDQASFAGSKNFRFSAVARKGGNPQSSLSFSFFDPQAGKYVTLMTPPRSLKISGKDLPDETPVAAAAAPPMVTKEPGLIGQRSVRAPAASLVPLVSRPAFIPLLALSGLAVAGGAVIGGIRSRRSDPQRKARAAMEMATREALDAASTAKDVPGFFAAARLALQQRLGSVWNQPAQAITSAEVESRIPGDSPVARFFREADLHEYNRQPSAGIQPQWRSLLDEALASLTPSTR